VKGLFCAIFVMAGWHDVGLAMERKPTLLTGEAGKILAKIRMRIMEDSQQANGAKWWGDDPEAVRRLVMRAPEEYDGDLGDLAEIYATSSTAQAREMVSLFSYLLHEQYRNSDAIDAVSTNRKLIDALAGSLARRLALGLESHGSTAATTGSSPHDLRELSSDGGDDAFCGVCAEPVRCHRCGVALEINDEVLCHLALRRDGDAVPTQGRDRATQTLLH